MEPLGRDLIGTILLFGAYAGFGLLLLQIVGDIEKAEKIRRQAEPKKEWKRSIKK